ncbi:MAG: hypothetical protein E7675_04955 [Ruminococcaceae bacterium]|nr:hypothetical protein [Oscillospiraceae bacterium]
MQIKTLQYYRTLLDSHDQGIYDKMFQHWMHFERRFTIPTPHAPLSELIQAVHMDNPMLFYIDYYKVRFTSSIFGLTIEGGYLYEKEEARRYLDECRSWGDYLVGKMPKGLQVHEKALWLHDAVIANVSYGNGDNIRSHNLIGVIADKVAVCEGIAMAYKLLCDLGDVPCIFVSGSHTLGPHAWNMIWVNNGCSFVDVTNDINKIGGDRYGRHYFLRKDSEMIGYTWDRKMIPPCKICNKSNCVHEAGSKEELVRIINDNISSSSIGIHLAYAKNMSSAELNLLIGYLSVKCRGVAGRSFSYSEDPLILYINK